MIRHLTFSVAAVDVAVFGYCWLLLLVVVDHCWLSLLVICCYMLLYVVICCYMLLYVVICCYMLLYVVICCYMLLYVVICCYMLLYVVICCYMLLYVVICCYLLLFVVVVVGVVSGCFDTYFAHAQTYNYAALVHTGHMPKPVITFAFKVRCYVMDCFDAEKERHYGHYITLSMQIKQIQHAGAVAPSFFGNDTKKILSICSCLHKRAVHEALPNVALQDNQRIFSISVHTMADPACLQTHGN